MIFLSSLLKIKTDLQLEDDAIRWEISHVTQPDISHLMYYEGLLSNYNMLKLDKWITRLVRVLKLKKTKIFVVQGRGWGKSCKLKACFMDCYKFICYPKIEKV